MKKRKSFIMIILGIILLIILTIAVACSAKITNANADTIQPIYKSIMFDYRYLTGESEEECTTLIESEKDVLNTKPIIQFSNSDEVELSIDFEGDEYSAINKGGVNLNYIGKNAVHIECMKGFQTNSITIQNSRGNVIERYDTATINTELSDGYYTIIYTGCNEWEENNETKAVKLVAMFKFVIDTDKPEIQLVESDTNNNISINWDGEEYIALLNGSTYNKGEYISQEGKNTVEVRKPYGPFSVVEFDIDHFYATEKVESSCIEGGYTLHTCINCGDSYKDELKPKLEHNYVVENTVEPTCTGNGYISYSCKDCGATYEEIKPAIAHNYLIINYPSTCTEYGNSHYTCQVCGFEFEELNGVYPTGHDYTCTIVLPATCTEQGLRRYTCDVCGDSFDMVISAIGHNYIITDTVIENGSTLRTYTCTVCGETYQQEISAQYEQVAEFIENLIDKYTLSLVWMFIITAGIWSIAMGVTIAIAHKNEDKEKSKKMLVNYAIGLIVIAVILLACPLLVRGIAALIT